MAAGPSNSLKSARHLIGPAVFRLEDNPLWVSHAYSLRGLIPPAILLVLAWVVFPFDASVSHFCFKLSNGRPAFLKTLLDNAEPFGHGVGVVIAGLLVLSLERKQWKAGFTLMTAGIGAGLLANLVKICIGRFRPRNYDFPTLDSHATFSGWLPILEGGSGNQSFPSAHTAAAVGVAIVLSTLYPRARWLFCLLAVLVMGHRLHSGAHYPSDILVGAAIGWLFAIWCIRIAVRHRYLIVEDPARSN